MRFLIFNAAVVVALVYLLSAERSEVHSAADRLYDTVQDLEASARARVGDLGRAQADDVPAAEPPAIEDRAQPTEVLTRQEEAQEDPRPTREADPQTKPEQPRGLAEAAPAPPEPANDAPQVPAASQDFAASLPPVSDPAVARRRSEVLEGIVDLGTVGETDGAAPPAKPEIALTEGETLMQPEQRVRELYALAEEMELLFVTKLAR